MQERMTLCNMTAELGGQTGLIASDDVTRDYLKAEIERWDSDPDAALLAHHRFNASELQPKCRAAQPGQYSAGYRLPAEDRSRLHRRLHRREARGSAHGRRSAQAERRKAN